MMDFGNWEETQAELKLLPGDSGSSESDLDASIS